MLKKHIITLGGYPGSGKTTVRHLLAEHLGYQVFSTGHFARTLAEERGMTLEAFNELAATSIEVDHLIDAELERIEREEDDFVIDSHLAFHFVPSAFSVYLNISLETASIRVFGDRDSDIRKRSGDVTTTLEEAREKTLKRIENHEERYMRHYGLSPYKKERYMFVIHTEGKSPQEITDAILIAYDAWLRA
jgi:CMP/dCMP kinase